MLLTAACAVSLAGCPPFSEEQTYRCTNAADCPPALECHPGGFCVACESEPCLERERRCAGAGAATSTGAAICCAGSSPCS